MDFPNFKQNATALDNLSRAAERAILGRLTAYFGQIRKKARFLVGLPCFSLFDNFISIYFYRLQDTVKKLFYNIQYYLTIFQEY